MARKSKFQENSESIDLKDTRSSYLAYLESKGPEAGASYLDALDDVLKEIEPFFTRKIGENYYTNSPANIAKQLKQFVSDKTALVKTGRVKIAELEMQKHKDNIVIKNKKL